MKNKNKIISITLILVLLVTSILSGFPTKMINTLLSYADGEIQKDELTTLRFGMTYLPNQGIANSYPRGKMKKEFLTGSGTDKWSDFANKYTFCMANHAGHPPIGALATVERTFSLTEGQRPLYELGEREGQPMTDFDFALEIVMMYYLGSHVTNLNDSYADAADYLIGKQIHTVNYQFSQMTGNLEADLETFDRALQNNIIADFNPDINGNFYKISVLTGDIVPYDQLVYK